MTESLPPASSEPHDSYPAPQTRSTRRTARGTGTTARRSGCDRRRRQVPQALARIRAAGAGGDCVDRRSPGPPRSGRRRSDAQRPGAARTGRRGNRQRHAAAGTTRRRTARPPDSEGRARRRRHLPGSARRHRRRRSSDLRRRSVPHVRALCGAAGLEGRSRIRQSRRTRRLQGNHRPRRRPRRLFPAQVRIRHPPRAARSGNRIARPHPHLRGDRGDHSGRKRRGDRSRSIRRT